MRHAQVFGSYDKFTTIDEGNCRRECANVNRKCYQKDAGGAHQLGFLELQRIVWARSCGFG